MLLCLNFRRYSCRHELTALTGAGNAAALKLAAGVAAAEHQTSVTRPATGRPGCHVTAMWLPCDCHVTAM
jgi:hypothetical protein